MTRNRHALLVLVAALAMVAASCGGGDDEASEDGGETTAVPSSATLTAGKLPGASVQLSDLPSGYSPKAGFPKQVSSAAECVNVLAQGLDAVTAQLQALGLEGCYLAVYNKEKGSDANSPGSGAFLFRDVNGATQALPILRSAGAQSLKPSGGASIESSGDVPVTGLGDQSAPGVTATIAVGPRKFTITLFFWRSRNVVFYSGGGDSLGDLKQSSYLDLSKKVASRAGV
jgi:hypothetical protein